jgi:hypothetical protein
MPVKIEATGATVADALAGLKVKLAEIATDELLTELRQRFAKHEQVVQIAPFWNGKDHQRHNSRKRKAA